jgi:hypothetical protein
MKSLYSVVLIFLSLSFLALGILRSNGYVGATEKNGGAGCNCHSFSPSTQVSAWVTGPDSLLIGTSATYRLYVTGGPRVTAGFNLASRTGKVASVDNFTKLMQYVVGDTQLTHTSPRAFNSDTLFWNFRYTAPNSIGFDTIYSVVNSTNGNGQSDGNDRWNFGRKFAIRIYNNPVSVENENPSALNFILYQNYPNPFNPNTNIKYELKSPGYVVLKIFDAIGNEVATLVNEFQQAGMYEVKFNSYEVNGSLTSGIYYYKISSGSFTEVRKMLLIK